MNIKTKRAIKKQILKNFLRLIDSRPELKNDKEIKDAYNSVKNKFEGIKK